MTREQLAVPRAEFRSYYGRQVLKYAGVELDDRGVPVLGRAVGRIGDAGGRGGPDGSAGAAAGVAGRVVGEHPGELVLPGRGSRVGRSGSITCCGWRSRARR